MLEKRFVKAAVIAAAALAMTQFFAQPARAASVDVAVSVTVSPASTPNPDDGLDGAFGGSPTTLLHGILCPVVTAVSGATTNIPGVGPILDQLPGIVCAINVAGYVYRTTYLPPSGPPVVKYTKAIVGVPALIDVDGKGLPDFTGLIGIALPGLSLQLSRSLLFSASERVSIEAVAIVPGVANTYVGFGEDGLAAGTAKHWKAALTIAGFSSTTADLKLAIDTLNPPSSLAAIGEMFSGPDPDAPERTYRGNAAFSPVPASFTTQLRLSQGRQQVIVGSTPTKLTAKLDMLSPGRAQNVNVVADQLPSSIDVVHETSGSTDTTTYDANAPIAKLTGTYKDTFGDTIATSAALDAWGVPAHIKFEQAAEKTTVAATQGGKFDRVQARFAQGSDVGPLNPSTSPFANFHRTSASAFKANLQLNNLKSVAINQSEPYGGRLIFDTAPGLFPFEADDDVTSTHLEGSLSNMPADTEVLADLDNGTVTFDGHGTGINTIALKATKATPFFAEVTRLEATLDGLPAYEVIDIKQENGGVTASASAPLGTITLLASDGSDAPAIAGSVASFVDNGSIWRAFLRMSGLKSVGFQPNPLTADLQTSAPQVFRVNGDVGGLTFDGTINQLPSHLTFSMADVGANQKIEFDTHGQEIGNIDVHGSGLPAPAGMPNFEAKIVDLPALLTLTLPEAGSGGTVKLDLHGDHITRVYAQAYGNGQHLDVPDANTRHRLEFVENSRVVANLLGVGSAEFGMTGPTHIKYDVGSQPLDYVAVMADAKFLRGVISNPTPASIDFITSNKVDVHYRATTNTQINSITLKTNLAGGYIDADLQNIAPDVRVCFSSTNKACQPGFVPRPTVTVGDKTFNMPPALFDFSLTPTNLGGGLWPNRFELDGTYCFDESDPATCLDGSNKKKRIAISDLRFGKVAVGAGFRSFDCTACTAGRVYAYFDTDDTLISGDVKYFEDGDDGAFVHYHSDGDDGGIQAQNKLLFADYCLPTCIDYDDLTLGTAGTFTCVSEPHLDIDIPVFDDLDVLSGSFIHFC